MGLSRLPSLRILDSDTSSLDTMPLVCVYCAIPPPWWNNIQISWVETGAFSLLSFLCFSCSIQSVRGGHCPKKMPLPAPPILSGSYISLPYHPLIILILVIFFLLPLHPSCIFLGKLFLLLPFWFLPCLFAFVPCMCDACPTLEEEWVW